MNEPECKHYNLSIGLNELAPGFLVPVGHCNDCGADGLAMTVNKIQGLLERVKQKDYWQRWGEIMKDAVMVEMKEVGDSLVLYFKDKTWQKDMPSHILTIPKLAADLRTNPKAWNRYP